MGPILLVDDERAASDACAAALRRRGFEVDAACTFEGALRRVRRRRYSAAVVEFNLRSERGDYPRTARGLALLVRLRRSLPGCRIFVYTAMGGGLYRAAALRAGADGFLVKTMGIDPVVDVLRPATGSPAAASILLP